MLLFKDGDPEVVENYRGNALGSCGVKVWTKVLTGVCRRENTDRSRRRI